MWPEMVVMLSPFVDDGARISQAVEPVLVQAILAELATETLDEGIMGWLTWLNEVQLHASSIRPEELRLTCQFGAIIQNNTF